ncbi:hypothetical protein [uncultured Methanobrevibacter sp.]|uniref:hypothetical protein n=1 Tax=uncultured Methanobrevibacter sp. TaxID=253161 RepID=UPI0025DE5834|nr:hypothetical protein [uncultured Methanobrevibacter sp.]
MTWKRFTIHDSKYHSGVDIYDNLLHKVVIEIHTGNKQINRLIAKAALRIIEGKL